MPIGGALAGYFICKLKSVSCFETILGKTVNGFAVRLVKVRTRKGPVRQLISTLGRLSTPFTLYPGYRFRRDTSR